VQLLKASLLISVTPGGIVILANFEQPWNAVVLIVATVSGILRLESPEPLNAEAGIVVRLNEAAEALVNVTAKDMSEQYSKTCFSRNNSPDESIVTDCNAVQLLNASWLICVTDAGKVMDERPDDRNASVGIVKRLTLGLNVTAKDMSLHSLKTY